MSEDEPVDLRISFCGCGAAAAVALLLVSSVDLLGKTSAVVLFAANELSSLFAFAGNDDCFFRTACAGTKRIFSGFKSQ